MNEFERDVSKYIDERGNRLISVTEALSAAGVVDLSGIAPSVLEAASKRGQKVHVITAEMDCGKSPDVPVELAGYISAWKNFVRETRWCPIERERVVISHRHQYAGTLDCLGHVHDVLSLVDIKTGEPPPETGMQLAGYEVGLQEEYQRADVKWEPVRRYALGLRWDGNYSLVPYRNISDRSDFMAALRITRWLVRNGRYQL